MSMAPHPIHAHDPEALTAALCDLPQEPRARLTFFGREAAPATGPALTIANEVVAASGGRVGLDVFDLDLEPALARSFGVRRAPATAVLGPEGDTGIRFYGALEEFAVTGFVAAVRLAAGVDPGLPPALRAQLGELAAPLRLEVFVSPWDDESPALVRTAAAIALGSPEVRLEVVSAPDFPKALAARRVVLLPAVLLEGRWLPPTPDEQTLVSNLVREASAGAVAPP